MTARFRSIARKTGLDPARVDDIVSAAGVIPPLPGFDSPFDQAQPPDGILAVHTKRLSQRMTLLSRVFPILAGVALTAVELAFTPDLLMLTLHTVAWSLAAIVVFWAAYEVVVGLERRRLRDQLPDAYRKGSTFAGLSTAAEPRYYEGLYHYDLGLVRIDGGSLRFAGARCSFSIANSEAQRVWLASGPRHWTPRKIVCVEYRLASGITGVISLQSMERWFWPGTSGAAQQLFATLTEWSKSGELPATPASPPPQVAGAVLPRVRPGAVWKSMRVPCMVSLCASWFIIQMYPVKLEGLLAPFAAPVVTAALILFIFAPHLEWSQARPVERPSAQPPPCPEVE